MAATTLTSKGRITIPKEVRERLGLKKGDCLIFRFDEHGNLLLQLEDCGLLGRLPGMLQHLAKNRSVDVQEMNEAVKQRAAKRFERSVKR